MIIFLLTFLPMIQARYIICPKHSNMFQVVENIHNISLKEYDVYKDEVMHTFGWGLDRINQRHLPLDNITYGDVENGNGTIVYIIDSGMEINHSEFTYVQDGVDYVDGTFAKCADHGTHVGGIVGSQTYGVATKTMLVNVRVMNCQGTGFISDIVQGIQWAINDCNGRRCILNLSLGGNQNPFMDQAIRIAYDAGLIPVCAAGNSDIDACSISPARESKCITVASTQINDARSGFSNWGSCVDIFAPGTSIPAPVFNNQIGVKSGTSMATPHVAGVLALLWKDGLSRDKVVDKLFNLATRNIITDTKNTTNALLYVEADETSGGNILHSSLYFLYFLILFIFR